MSMTRTYAEILAEAIGSDEYRQFVSASAFFDVSGEAREIGMHVEAPAIGFEFIDNIEIGRDPTGYLFFHALDNIFEEQPVYYDAYYNIVPQLMTHRDEDGIFELEKDNACIVDFYHSVEGSGRVNIAKFIGCDPNRTLDRPIFGRKGVVRKSDFLEVQAHIRKAKNSRHVLVHLGPLSKLVEFDLRDLDFDVEVQGMIAIRNIDDISTGQRSYVDYNSKRVVFSSGSDGGLKAIAVFTPNALAVGNTALCPPSYSHLSKKPDAAWFDQPFHLPKESLTSTTK